MTCERSVIHSESFLEIANWVEHIADKDTHGIFTKKKEKKKYRKLRVQHFFNTLFWMLTERNDQLKTDNHLLFYNSFKQIETTLNLFDALEDENIDFLEVEKKGKDILFQYFEIILLEQPFIIVFYDAKKGNEIQHSKVSKKAYYKLFWQEKPVVLITTYPSAGNGVNLQYYSTEALYNSLNKQPNKDFTCLHLLESPFYYFSPINLEEDSVQQKNAIIRKNIYNLSKLQKNDILTHGKFKEFLGSIRNSYIFNTTYRDTEDAMINQISVFIQALGRIERVWEKSNNQLLRVTTEIYNLLEAFVTDSNYASLYSQVQPFFSANLQQAFIHIKEQAQNRDLERNDWIDNIEQQNNKCREYIHKILREHERVRRGILRTSESKKIRKDWETLRRLALQHRFHKASKKNERSLLYVVHSVFETDAFDCKRKGLWMNNDKEIVLYDVTNHTHKLWRLDGIYEVIKQNDTIRNYFEHKHYSLGFKGKGYYFVPYFYQSILVGGIGEEALKAIFQDENISLSEQEILNQLFEVTDTKVQDKAWYIDCKNYSEHTIINFSLPEDDPLRHPKLNEPYFKKRALEKLSTIKSVHGKSACKLIYINIFGSNDRPVRYLNENFEDVENFRNAEIIVVQSAINRASPNELCEDFQQFIHQLKNNL